MRSKVSCTEAKQEPSFTWMKTKFFESRFDFTQPHTVTERPSGSDVSKSFINTGFIVVYFIILISSSQLRL